MNGEGGDQRLGERCVGFRSDDDTRAVKFDAGVDEELLPITPRRYRLEVAVGILDPGHCCWIVGQCCTVGND